VSQEDGPIRRLKWGTASLIVRAPVTPIVLPIVHHGFEEVVFLVLSPILSTLSL
jgi:monolysocardiolipin acyltransferase